LARSWRLSHAISASFTVVAKASVPALSKSTENFFSMISSKGEFVVKLPAHRVDELVRDGTGQHFDAGHGKKMKEWLALSGKPEMWIELARDARHFVGNR